jgi:hypothetical protein
MVFDHLFDEAYNRNALSNYRKNQVKEVKNALFPPPILQLDQYFMTCKIILLWYEGQITNDNPLIILVSHASGASTGPPCHKLPSYHCTKSHMYSVGKLLSY